MSDDKKHPVPDTLNAFEKVFESIVELALIGAIDDAEDKVLSGIVEQIQSLHDQFSARALLEIGANSPTIN